MIRLDAGGRNETFDGSTWDGSWSDLTPAVGYAMRYVQPGWRRDGDRLELCGAVQKSSGNFAVGWNANILTGLPTAMIPSGYAAGRTLFMPAQTDNGTTVLIGVETTGNLSIYVTTGNTTVTTVYLEGLSWRRS